MFSLCQMWPQCFLTCPISGYLSKTNTCTSIAHDTGWSYYNGLIQGKLDIIFVTVIPITCLIVGNLMIITRLVWERAKAKQLKARKEGAKNDDNMVPFALMLMFTNFAYVLCICPKQIFVLLVGYHRQWNWSTPNNRTPVLFLLQETFVNVQYLNYAINFWLYLASGRHFRNQLIGMFHRFSTKICDFRRPGIG